METTTGTEKPDVTGNSLPTEPERSGGFGRWLLYGIGGLVALVVLYYVLGAAYFYKIDDDVTFIDQIEVPENGSAAVAVAAALVDREVNVHRWLANDPFFMPGSILDNTPNYQRGIVAALSRFAVELTDEMARVRGSSQIDRNAEDAAGQLKYPGDVWFLAWSSTPVQPSSESQYRQAIDNLQTYNERLSSGEAVFERRSDNLLATLDRIGSDIGSTSAALFQHIDDNAGSLYDAQADDLFYSTKGRLYGYLMILKGIERDFADVISSRELASVWSKLIESLEASATLSPLVIANGSLDGQLMPNHLTSQGFMLLRARIQLREVSNILLK